MQQKAQGNGTINLIYILSQVTNEEWDFQVITETKTDAINYLLNEASVFTATAFEFEAVRQKINSEEDYQHRVSNPTLYASFWARHLITNSIWVD